MRTQTEKKPGRGRPKGSTAPRATPSNAGRAAASGPMPGLAERLRMVTMHAFAEAVPALARGLLEAEAERLESRLEKAIENALREGKETTK